MSGAKKIQSKPRKFCCVRKWENAQRLMGSCLLLTVCSGQAPKQVDAWTGPKMVCAEGPPTPRGLPGHHGDTCLRSLAQSFTSGCEVPKHGGFRPNPSHCQGLQIIGMLWVNQVCYARWPKVGIYWPKVTDYYSFWGSFPLWLWWAWLNVGTELKKGELGFSPTRMEWLTAPACKKQTLTWILNVKKHCLKSLERQVSKRRNRYITWDCS